MNINAWGKLAALSCAAAVIALACNSSTTSNGTGGAAGAAGTGTGGTGGGTGGTGGTGGGTGGTGGGTGGTGGMPADGGGACMSCLTASCPGTWTACAADSTCLGEFACIQNCVLGDAGMGTGQSVTACAAICAMDAGTISGTTSNLVGCIDSDAGGCNAECFGGAQP